MELRERNYRSRLGTRRSTKERREFGDGEETKTSTTSRDKFSITENARQPRLDPFYTIKKWLPWVVAAAVAYWAVTTFVF